MTWQIAAGALGLVVVVVVGLAACAIWKAADQVGYAIDAGAEAAGKDEGEQKRL